MMVFGILSAINLNLAFNGKSNIYLSLSGIEALANGELGNCAGCGNTYNECTCWGGIVCDHGSCNGKVCHENTNNWSCRCTPTGNQYTFCA